MSPRLTYGKLKDSIGDITSKMRRKEVNKLLGREVDKKLTAHPGRTIGVEKQKRLFKKALKVLKGAGARIAGRTLGMARLRKRTLKSAYATHSAQNKIHKPEPKKSPLPWQTNTTPKNTVQLPKIGQQISGDKPIYSGSALARKADASVSQKKQSTMLPMNTENSSSIETAENKPVNLSGVPGFETSQAPPEVGMNTKKAA
jgi:hypothetical protein